MDDETLILLTNLEMAPNKLKVFKVFGDEEYLRPCEIAKIIGKPQQMVSTNLNKLKSLGLIYLMNPDYFNPHIYRLTDKGRRL